MNDKLTQQEEIFCQWYYRTIDTVLSAYKAGMMDFFKDEIEFSKLDKKQRKKLSSNASYTLKKQHVRERISFLAGQEAEKSKKASLEECLAFVTSIMRKAKNENLSNIFTIREAIKAVEILLKHFPDYEKGAKKQDSIIFAREREGS